MKTLIKLLPLAFTVLFAVAIGGVRCPLYTREEVVVEEKDEQVVSFGLEVWQSSRANGLIKYHFRDQGRKLTWEIWAKNRETAVRKLCRQQKLLSMVKIDKLRTPDCNSVYFIAKQII